MRFLRLRLKCRIIIDTSQHGSNATPTIFTMLRADALLASAGLSAIRITTASHARRRRPLYFVFHCTLCHCIATPVMPLAYEIKYSAASSIRSYISAARHQSLAMIDGKMHCRSCHMRHDILRDGIPSAFDARPFQRLSYTARHAPRSRLIALMFSSYVSFIFHARKLLHRTSRK